MSAQFAWQLTNLAVINFLVTSADLGSHSCPYFCHWPGWPWCILPGQSGLWTWLNKVFKPGFGPSLPRPGQGRAGRLTTASRFFLSLSAFTSLARLLTQGFVSVVLI